MNVYPWVRINGRDFNWDGKVFNMEYDTVLMDWIAQVPSSGGGGGGDASAANQILTNTKLDSLIAAIAKLTDNIDIKALDNPILINCASTTINGSAGAFVQLEAVTSALISQLLINDGTGEFIGIYKGPLLSEVLVAIVGGGAPNQQAVDIPAGSRLSARSLKTTSVTTGEFSIVKLGPQ